MSIAVVQYTPGQTDDEGNPVGTEPFEVVFEDTGDAIGAIMDTGNVQFDWILIDIEG